MSQKRNARLNEEFISRKRQSRNITDTNSIKRDLIEYYLAQFLKFDKNELLTPQEIKIIYNAYKPENFTDAKEKIYQCIQAYGFECDLNWLNFDGWTSLINKDDCTVLGLADYFSSVDYEEFQERFNPKVEYWNVNTVEKFDGLFYDMFAFKPTALYWQTPNMTSCSDMFNGCCSIETLDLSTFCFDNVKSIGLMFAYCRNLSDLKLPNIENINIDNVDGCKNPEDMKYVFYECNYLSYDIKENFICSFLSQDKIDNILYSKDLDSLPLNEEYIPRKRRESISRIEEDIPYFHLSSPKKHQILTSREVLSKKLCDSLNLEYSLDKEEWKPIDMKPNEQFQPIGFYENLWIRGKCPYGTSLTSFTSDNDYEESKNDKLIFYTPFPNQKPSMSIDGDIRTLIDWQNYRTCDTSEARFFQLFRYCDWIKDASNLNLFIDEMADNCYRSLFYGCHNLLKAPKLPAKILSPSCYESMFSGCTSLKKAPDLPATQLAESCYAYMFSECERLSAKAKIPKNINQNTYEFKQNTKYMYHNCFEGIHSNINEEYVPRNRRTSISIIDTYSCHPHSKDELREIILERINKEGLTCNLNDIDVSYISDMSYLFNAGDMTWNFSWYLDADDKRKYYLGDEIFKDFNGDISKWNVSNVTNMECMFTWCEKFNQDLSKWDVSSVTNMSYMFRGCRIFNSDISQWDVSSVTNMESMFTYCEDFDSDISQWDVSNVTDMREMFDGCYVFNQDISRWDVSNVRNMYRMFSWCTSFGYDLSSWDISNADNTETVKSHMKQRKHINEEYIPRQRRDYISRIEKDIPYIHFTCDGKQEIMFAFFDKTDFFPNLEYSLDKNEWNPIYIDDKDNYIPHIIFDDNLWIRGKNNINGTNRLIISFDNTDDVFIDVEGDIRTLIDWENYLTCDTSKAKFINMFSFCKQLRDASNLRLPILNLSAEYCYQNLFCECQNLTKAPDLPATKLSKGCYDCMFALCKSLEEKAKVPVGVKIGSEFGNNMYKGCNFDIEQIDENYSLNEEYVPRKRRISISKKINQYTCHPKTKDELREIIIERINEEGYTCDLNDIDVSNITDMSELFDAWDNEIFEDFNGDISMWDVSNVTNMNCMFQYCKNFDGDISMWNVSNVTDMKHMFCGCNEFNCDLSRWDVSRVTNMAEMFCECIRFNSDISQWNVSKVTKMWSMFQGCESFNQDISKWNVSKVRDMYNIFYRCDSFNYDLSNWDISNAVNTDSVKEHMLKYINEEYVPRQKRNSISKLDSYIYHPQSKEELREIIIERINEEGDTCDLNDIDTSNITDMSFLFNSRNFYDNENDKNYDGNEIFQYFNGDITYWNVSNVTNMRGMFRGCLGFNPDLSRWNVSRVTDMGYMFKQCKSFKSDLSRWDVSNVADMNCMFDNCREFNSDLSKWDVSNVRNMRYMFYECNNFNSDLSRWDVSKVRNMTGMFDGSIRGCASLQKIPDWFDEDVILNSLLNEEYVPRQRRSSISKIKEMTLEEQLSMIIDEALNNGYEFTEDFKDCYNDKYNDFSLIQLPSYKEIDIDDIELYIDNEDDYGYWFDDEVDDEVDITYDLASFGYDNNDNLVLQLWKNTFYNGYPEHVGNPIFICFSDLTVDEQKYIIEMVKNELKL